jgi:hypothetical protein
MRNVVAIQRGLVLVPDGNEGSAQLAASLQAELMNLGFALDSAAFAAASRAPREWLANYYAEVIPYLRKRLGAERDHPPFYRNFPAQVMEASHLELFLNAFIHYRSNGTWEPPQALRDRGFAFEGTTFNPVRLGTEADLKAIFAKLVSINQSLTQQDNEAIVWLIDTYRDELELPKAIPFKETLCLLAARGMDVPIKTPTDVLRVAVYLSGGDVSLPAIPKPTVKEIRPGLVKWFLDHLLAARKQARENFKFRKFSRAERRLILGLLEKTNADPTEMQRHLGRWLRLGEILHVGEYASRFPRSAAAFHALRNQRKRTKVRTFAARVDLAFREGWRDGVDLLATRPGEFARRLDWMLRTRGGGDREYVLATFDRVGRDVSSKVLFELYDHFGQRLRPDAPRVVMLKGARSKMKTLPPLPPMDRDLVRRIGNAILTILRARAAALQPLGKVWIDDRLKGVPLPFAMRSVNTSVKTYVRGTRIPFRPEAKVVRAFIHWFDEHGSIDLDLSAGLYDASLKPAGHISFTNLKLDRLNCCHSGDIRHRKGPCAEYVDLDVERCLANGVRYATLLAFNYDAEPMHTVKDCVFGLMEREHAQANEIFVPKTISNCMALANEGTSVIVCVVDLERREYIWADVEADRALATLENTASRSAEVLRALVEGTKMSVHELLTLHAHARGTIVTDPAAADLRLRWDDFVTGYANVAAYMNL